VAWQKALNRRLEISPDQSLTPYALGMTFLLTASRATARTSPAIEHEVFRLAGAALAEHDLGQPSESQRALTS